MQSLDEINKTINLLVSRLREWNGFTFPELNRQISDHEQLARIISSLGSKETMTAEKLIEIKIPETKAKKIAELAQQSIGAQLSDEDLVPIQQLAKAISDLYQQRKNNEKYLERTMQKIAPNMTALIGPHIAARLISLARGLDKLARMPSSTVQILGAEKALFRSKKTGSRPPKHGIIYQVSAINEAKRWQRGKISRLVAGKLSIAARVDAYSGKPLETDISADLQKRIAHIKRTSATPPPRKEWQKPMDRSRNRRPKQFKSRPQRRDRPRYRGR